MPNLTGTNFYQSLQSPFSEALQVVQVATDPKIEQRDGVYPPVLTAAEFAGHLATRSDVFIDENNQAGMTKEIYKRLLMWTGEEFFELVPIQDADSRSVEIGFRITEQGMRTADKHLRDHGVRLLGIADRVVARLKAGIPQANPIPVEPY